MTSSAPLLTMMMRGVRSFLESASGNDKVISILNRMVAKLEGKLASFLRIKGLERLQRKDT